MFIKQLISSFLMPLPICLGTVAAGALLLWFTARQRAGRWLVTVGLCLLTLLSYTGVANLFIRPLENDYQPLLVEGRPGPLDGKAKAARWIVVLGGGHALNRSFPPNSELTETTLARLIEALRLKRQLPAAKVILSGGFGSGPKHAELLADTAAELGFAREELVLEQRTFDTADEARYISGLVGADPFILVTSASHLPRAVALFRKQGRDPIPSPTGFTAISAPGVDLGVFFPTSSGIGKLERACHEYIGRVWSKLRGQT